MRPARSLPWLLAAAGLLGAALAQRLWIRAHDELAGSWWIGDVKAAREGKPVEVLFTTSFDWPSSARSSTVVVAASGRYRLLLDGTHVGAGERGGASLAVPAPSGSGVHRLTVGVFHAEGAAALRLRMTFPEMKGVEGVVTDPTWMTGDDAEKEFRERGSSDGAHHPATLLTSSPLSAMSFSISRNGT